MDDRENDDGLRSRRFTREIFITIHRVFELYQVVFVVNVDWNNPKDSLLRLKDYVKQCFLVLHWD